MLSTLPATPKIAHQGPKKVKNDPKIKSKWNVRIERNIENKICWTTWVDPKTVVELYSNHKNSPLGPPKVKNDPKNSPLRLQKVKNSRKIKSNSKVRIEESIKNESCSTIFVDPKTLIELKPVPKLAGNCPKRFKIIPKTKQSKTKNKKSHKMKVISLYK